MSSFFDNLSYSDLVEMVEKDHKRRIAEAAKENPKLAALFQNSLPDREHAPDTFSVYAYGDFIRVVYRKTPRARNAPTAKKTELSQNRDSEERFSQSVARTRARIFELAMCNEFQFFCTFTQDEKKRDRFDLAEFRKDFTMLIRNLNRDREEGEKIKYLLIPEKHKNGAWHMHGLFAGLTEKDLRPFTLKEKLPHRLRASIKAGKTVFDWLRYRKAFGYFTCTAIENRTACAKYITKYVTKDLAANMREAGAHMFFASQGLKGREVILKNCNERCFVKEWDYENNYVKVAEFNAAEK